MSLINQVLQDLEQRGVQPAQDPQFHYANFNGGKLLGEIRPVAVTRSRGRRLVIVWLLVLGAVLLVSFSAWSSRGQVSELIADARLRIDALLAGSGDALLPVASSTPPTQQAQEVQAQVKAALMVPVFQLSDELASVPEQPEPTVPEPTVPEHNAPAVAVLRVPAAVPVATAFATHATEDKPASTVVKQPRTAVPRKRPSQARAVRTETIAPAKTAATDPGETGVPSITKSVIDSEPEEIVIAADATERPIEKQARQLTAYERAENTFRQGIASLRNGRKAEAESRFREALNEDRSHAAARQALIGILIDSGRLVDAQAVLADALDANPRQPGLAMLLARLQVESGDLGAALQTLERTSSYAGSDADYRAFRAAVLQRAGRHDEAVEQYRNALALAPGNAVWLMGLGISLRSLGEYDMAKEAFASAASARTLTPDLQAFVEQQRREMERALN